jgi:hypothetical protein
MVAKDGVWMIWTSDRTNQEVGKGDVLWQGAHRHYRRDGDDRGDDREESKHRWLEPRYQRLSGIIRSGVIGTHKESDAHVLVVKYILSMSFKLIISTSLGLSGKTYLDQLDDLGERMRISLQLLPNSPILSSLSLDIVKLIHNFLSCGPGPTR